MHAPITRRRAAGLTATAMLGLAMPRAFATEPTRLRVRLDWTPWGSQAGIHLASVKGWFRDSGLDVAIADGNGSTQTVQITGAGDEVDVGFAALSSMMIARDKGMPLRAVAAYARNSDIGLMVPIDSPIHRVADLKGKRLGYTASSLETPFLGEFLAAGGLSRADAELVNLDGATKLGVYLEGRLDGAFSSIPFFVPAVKSRRPSRGILFADNGLHIPSYGLFAREETIAAKKDALTRFVSIVDGAWAYIAAGHQDEGVAAIHQERPNAKLDTTVMRGQVDMFLTFFPTPATKGDPPGVMAEADWEQAVATMRSVKLITTDLKAGDYYTNAVFDPTLCKHIAAA